MDESNREQPIPQIVVIYDPQEQQRRQAWEFKRRHIELMTLGKTRSQQY